MQPDISRNILSLTSTLLVVLVLSSCSSSTKKAPNDQDLASIHLQLGVRYMDLNKLEVAKENLQQALKEDPNNPQVHNALAFLYEKLNEYDKAEEQYEKAMDAAPNDWSVQNNFGRFLCERGQYEQGMTYLTQAVSTPLNDRQWMALTNAGRCQLGMKRPDKAKAYFKQALILNETYPPALLEMQKISYQNGDYWAAKGFLQRYLSVAPHTSGTLWVGMQTERALGNTELAKEYQRLLLEKFPISDEAKLVKPIIQ